MPQEQTETMLREKVRDFIYDCTKDESEFGWTLSAHQADDLIAIVRRPMSDEAATKTVDDWHPDPDDPFWMLEVPQGYEDAGAWLKNERTFLTTRDPTKALRFPSFFEADCVRRRLHGNQSGRFEPTEHTWMAPMSDEVVVEMLVAAWRDGAKGVHDFLAKLPDDDRTMALRDDCPNFTEAAHTYARAAIDSLSSRGRGE